MHYDGTSWLPMKSDVLSALNINSVHVDNISGNVFLAGERGKIYEYDTSGASFVMQNTGISADLFIIREDLSGNLWTGGFGGVLLQDSGSGWSSIFTGDTEDIHDIDFLPDSNIWMAGGTDDSSCVSWAALHYDGNSWTKYGESGS